jgi:predicted nucleic acid-binding protein
MARARPLVGIDTSCLIPLFCEWHVQHEPTKAAIERTGLKSMVVCSQVVLECFSVLTRFPAPFRLPARQAEELLRENLHEWVSVTPLTASDAWDSIGTIAARNLPGGRVYDAAIAQATARAGASVLLTWNVRDFLTVAPAGLEIREPGVR